MPEANPATANATGRTAFGTAPIATSRMAPAFTARPQAATRPWRDARAATKPPARIPAAALTR